MISGQIFHTVSSKRSFASVAMSNVNTTVSHRPLCVENDEQKTECKMSQSMIFKIILALLLVSAASVVWAGNIEAGKLKAASCATCHGLQGKSSIPGYPHLAGQKAAYLVATLKNFKSGELVSPIMGLFAKPLSDTDISDLAAFYSSLQRCK